MKIAILDDDPAQMEAIVGASHSAGHRLTSFVHAQTLIAALRRDTFDMLIIDKGLSERCGLDVMAWAHLHLKSPPLMLLIADSVDYDDIADALDAGADGYLPKPLSPRLLEARIRALTRRPHPPPSVADMEVHGDIAFHEATKSVRRDDEEVVLTAKEFALALLLFRNQHRPLSRTYIREAVWGAEPSLNSRSLDMHISRVRTKLDLRPESGFRLTPIYGHGYQLEHVALA